MLEGALHLPAASGGGEGGDGLLRREEDDLQDPQLLEAGLPRGSLENHWKIGERES